MVFTIQLFQEDDIAAVLDIHREQFPDSRSTQLGRPFTNKMYQWFLETQPELALVAKTQARPVGFIVGAIGGYGRRIFRYAFPQAALGILLHPRLLVEGHTFAMWRSYARALTPKGAAPSNHGMRASNRASLSSIAVARSARRQGVARALMDSFEVNARHLGVEMLSLSVARDNHAARRLYESCGWQPVGSAVQNSSINYHKLLS